MTGSPYGVPPGGQWPPVGSPPPYPPYRQPRAPLVIAIIIGVIGITAAAVSWLRPLPVQNADLNPEPPALNYSDSQVADAKRNLCLAHSRVGDATELAGRQSGNDELSKFVVALGIRIAASLSADYLFRKLDENFSAPDEFTKPIYELAATYQDLLLLQIADAPSATLEPYYQRIDELDPQIVKACER